MSNVTKEMVQKWEKQLEYCIENDHKLNSWELRFIDSIWIRFCSCASLKIRQSFKLNEIYNKI